MEPEEALFKCCPTCELSPYDRETYYNIIEELRTGLQEIYRIRGEDEDIARIASPLIDKTRLGA